MFGDDAFEHVRLKMTKKKAYYIPKPGSEKIALWLLFSLKYLGNTTTPEAASLPWLSRFVSQECRLDVIRKPPSSITIPA
jgi:hypothetical protein